MELDEPESLAINLSLDDQTCQFIDWRWMLPGEIGERSTLQLISPEYTLSCY